MKDLPVKPPDKSSITDGGLVVHKKLRDRLNIGILTLGNFGNNMMRFLLRNRLPNVRYIAMDTDRQHLAQIKAESFNEFFSEVIGESITHGRGTGGNIDKAQQIFESDKPTIAQYINDLHFLFIIAGLGGGTAAIAPLIAELAKTKDILTIMVLVYPFSMEGERKKEIATKVLEASSRVADGTIVFHNETLIRHYADMPIERAFDQLNAQIFDTIQAMINLIADSGTINVSLGDIEDILCKKEGDHDIAILIGEGTGINRNEIATQRIIEQFQHCKLNAVHKLLLYVQRGEDFKLIDLQRIVDKLKHQMSAQNISIRISTPYKNMGDTIRIIALLKGSKVDKPTEEPDILSLPPEELESKIITGSLHRKRK